MHKGDELDMEITDNRKRYKITCPYCGRVQYACKSIAHAMGLSNMGHGTCLVCRRPMNLIFDCEKEEMTAEIWNWSAEYITSSTLSEAYSEPASEASCQTEKNPAENYRNQIMNRFTKVE